MESSEASRKSVPRLTLKTIKSGANIDGAMIAIGGIVVDIHVFGDVTDVGPTFAAQFAAPFELVDAELLDHVDDVFVLAVVLEEVGHAGLNSFRK